MREIATQEGLCCAEKIAVPAMGSGNGVDAEGKFNPAQYSETVRWEVRRRLQLPQNAMVIGFVGRLVQDKGIVELAQAWNRIKEEYPHAFLLLVGPLEPQDPVPTSTLQALEGDTRVRLTGRVAEVAPLYTAMDVLVLPTYREGFPNVPLEAAAMCLPVLTTRIPGCVDAVVSDVTGTLIEPRNPIRLYEALKRYIDQPELRHQHGDNGRERVLREFHPEEVWKAVYDEYCNLLDIANAAYRNPQLQGLVPHGS
jgi:glycosyltransferase involved in cell wall biosynthesis